MPPRYTIINVSPDEARTGQYLALRQVSQPVDPYAPETKAIIEALFDCLENGPVKGRGLAAPQVGILARIFVVNIPNLRPKSYGIDPNAPPIAETRTDPPLDYTFPIRTAVINPVITDLTGDTDKDYEACLSIRGVRGPVPRYRKIRVTGFNELGKPIDMVLDDSVARVFQHEADHLDGILYVDRMGTSDELEPYDF
jgi:peptide deformylase